MTSRNKIFCYIFIVCLIMILFSVVVAQEKENRDTVLCPKCNTKNPITAKFCSKCGQKLSKPKIQPEPIEQTHDTEPLIPPQITDETVPLTATELKAKAHYDHGVALFENGAYDDAYLIFKKIIEEYPTTKYAKGAFLMSKACYKMDALVKKLKMEEAKKKGGSSAFAAGFLGGILGTGAAILLLILIATG